MDYLIVIDNHTIDKYIYSSEFRDRSFDSVSKIFDTKCSFIVNTCVSFHSNFYIIFSINLLFRVYVNLVRTVTFSFQRKRSVTYSFSS